MSSKEQHHHEKVSTFLVSTDHVQVSANEIRQALESNDDEAKAVAMQKAIAAILSGESLPNLFFTIVRYVLPSEDHMVQKLLLLYMVSPHNSFSSIIKNSNPPDRPPSHTHISLFPYFFLFPGNGTQDRRSRKTPSRDDSHLSKPEKQSPASQ